MAISEFFSNLRGTHKSSPVCTIISNQVKSNESKTGKPCDYLKFNLRYNNL